MIDTQKHSEDKLTEHNYHSELSKDSTSIMRQPVLFYMHPDYILFALRSISERSGSRNEVVDQ